jgi:hypothetical protein
MKETIFLNSHDLENYGKSNWKNHEIISQKIRKYALRVTLRMVVEPEVLGVHLAACTF